MVRIELIIVHNALHMLVFFRALNVVVCVGPV